jgi:16S rRNA (guanine966-N2)-methyltransferase
MKVISGKYRGRQLIALEGRNTRPTSARVKEDMFNILSNWFIYDDKVSLDLFGGSGALSIEGLSRGIKFAHINDLSRDALGIIKKNLRDISSDEYQLYQSDFKRVLQNFSDRGVMVDLIYLDPPFPHPEYYYEFFTFLQEKNILNNYGVIVTESPMLLDVEKISYLKLLKHKDLKNKQFYLFRLEEE